MKRLPPNLKESLPTLTKRAATSNDFSFAQTAHHAAYHDVVIQQFGSWDKEKQDGFFKKAWDSVPHEILLLDGQPCGYCHIEDAGDHMELHELVLLPQYQGKGIGTQILNELIAVAKTRHIPVFLQVFKANRAIHLYKRLGFKEEGETDTHFKLKFIPV